MADLGAGGTSPMGVVPDPATGAFVSSERYVMLQTYTITNISGVPINNLELYQMLHGHPGDEYNSVVQSVYDSDDYGDPLAGYAPFNPVHTVGNFRYDITQWNNLNDPCSSVNHTDYIGFSSAVAPSVIENGFYTGHAGVKPPPPGTHWNIEARALSGATSSYGEIAGAQGWFFGTLNPGASVSQTVVLTPAVSGEVKWEQPPDPNGWDVAFRDLMMGSPIELADDWQCTETGPVEDFHLWLSWLNDTVGDISSVHVRIYSNDPCGQYHWSEPNELKWERTFTSGEFSWGWYGSGNQGWFDPVWFMWYRPDHNDYFIINIDDINDPFIQQEGEIYWLSIEIDANLGELGWKTSQDHWNDDAVYRCPGAGVPEWWELRDPLTDESLDFAFVITGEERPPEVLKPPVPHLKWSQPPIEMSPQPAGLLYGSSPGMGSMSLSTVNPSTGLVTIIGPFAGAPGTITEIEWSPDGSTLYGTTGGGVSTIHTIDPTTGAVLSTVAQIPPGTALQGLEFDASGVLLGTQSSGMGMPSDLVTVNTVTGVLTMIGPTGFGPIGGLAFDSGFNTLYGITSSWTIPPILLSVNPSTGAAVPIAVTTMSAEASSLEFTADGRLVTAGNDGNFYEINPTTGVATLIGPLVNEPKLSGLSLHPTGPTPPVYWGWDEISYNADYNDPCGPWKIVADDFRCLGSMPVTSIHWWGSHYGWEDANELPAASDLPEAWQISIWSNVPAAADNAKWSQLPDMNLGVDQYSVHVGDAVCSNDYLCTDPCAVVAVRWWGSYLDGTDPGPGPNLKTFELVFHYDVPAGMMDPGSFEILPYSHPTNHPFGDWLYYEHVTAEERYYGTTAGGEKVYEYIADLNEPFEQEYWRWYPFNPVPGSGIFWLDIGYVDPCDPPQAQWGWHESVDDRIDLSISNPSPSWHFSPWANVTVLDKDLAFEIITGEGSSYSHPEQLLWQIEVDANRVNVNQVGTDYFCTYYPNDVSYQYYLDLEPNEYFWQKDFEPNTFDNIFWLSIVAVYPDACEPPDYPWGWKTRPWSWMDDAVTFNIEDEPMPGMVLDPYSITPIEDPCLHESYDVAFELDTDPNYIKWEQPFTGIRDWPHYEDELSMAVEDPNGQLDILRLVADDWLCDGNTPVTALVFWGSYLGYEYKAGHEGPWMDLPVKPDYFRLNIWTDVPATQHAKWSQKPDLTDINGIDVDAVHWYSDPWGWQVLADDFLCTTTEPITDIYIWGSWLDDELPPGGPNDVEFWVEIFSDNPVGPNGWSVPDDMLWWGDFWPGDFDVWPYAEDLQEGYYSPYTGFYQPVGDTNCWLYHFHIDPCDAFIQQGDPCDPNVYWLVIQALPQTSDPNVRFGWKTSTDHHRDDAVWKEWWSGSGGPWIELRYPPGHPFAGQTIDLSFEINPGEGSSYSHPNDIIWEYDAYDYDEVLVGYDKHPLDPCDLGREPVFRYSVRLPDPNWFLQEDVNGIYWLSVVAVYDQSMPNYDWGWTNHKHEFNDDAVEGYFDPPAGWFWSELYDQTETSEDMSFILFTDPDLVVCTVPNVVGMMQAAATTAITNAGFLVGTVTLVDGGGAPLGQVMAQNPGPGIQLCGTTVDIDIAGDCLKTTHLGGTPGGYNRWLGGAFMGGEVPPLPPAPWSKPDCWCYPRQCRGDIDGAPIAPGVPMWVSGADLIIFRTAVNRMYNLPGWPAGGICADLDHAMIAPGVPMPVSGADLIIFRIYVNQMNIPCCDTAPTAGDCVLTAGDDFNFWTGSTTP